MYSDADRRSKLMLPQKLFTLDNGREMLVSLVTGYVLDNRGILVRFSAREILCLHHNIENIENFPTIHLVKDFFCQR